MIERTLNGLLEEVAAGRIVLPAMQRAFVWEEDRIRKLIDSLLRDFPLGTVLLWKTSEIQRFRKFEKDVRPDVGITTDFESGASTERYLVIDGQQRLQSLCLAFAGTYDGRRLFIDVLSGNEANKDPSEAYWGCCFLTEREAVDLNSWPRPPAARPTDGERVHYVEFATLTRNKPEKANSLALGLAATLQLDGLKTEQLQKTYLKCAILRTKSALQVHVIDEDVTDEPKPVEEVLEIFVRVNSAGLVLQKSDLLMSLLDIKWNEVQQDLNRGINEINAQRPFSIGRDDLLKSLLLAHGSDTRFDRLVADRDRVRQLAKELPNLLSNVLSAWKLLLVLLMDRCKITCERFVRSHNSLLPFVNYYFSNPRPGPTEERRLVTGLYISLMSGIFAGAEARMGKFAREQCVMGKPFPLDALANTVREHYGIRGLNELLSRDLDLTLNIAHGGVTLNNNPDELQRDHIFPRALLQADGIPDAQINHYANFHFLRAKDNLNKSATPPHEWFRKPGNQAAYSDADLSERHLNWELLQPPKFLEMLEARSKKIQERALALFGMSLQDFDGMFG